MVVLNVLLGAIVLLFGRRLFWLFVATVGFIVGALLATQALGTASSVVTLIIAILAGVIGAILSVFLQRIMVGIAGFFAAGYVFYTLALDQHQDSLAWIAFLIGGIVGAILLLALFDWALIGLSSVMGATLITQNLTLEHSISTVLFVGLLIVGILVQTRQMRGTGGKGKAGS